jgi:hypothetical protein
MLSKIRNRFQKQLVRRDAGLSHPIHDPKLLTLSIGFNDANLRI